MTFSIASFKCFYRVLAGLLFDNFESTVHDLLGYTLLAVIHDVVDQLSYEFRIVKRVRQERPSWEQILFWALCFPPSQNDFIGTRKRFSSRCVPCRDLSLTSLCTIICKVKPGKAHTLCGDRNFRYACLTSSLRRPSDALRRTWNGSAYGHCNALGIQSAADHVVTHTRQVLNTAASHHYHRVLLQVVAHAGDITARLPCRWSNGHEPLYAEQSSAFWGSWSSQSCRRLSFAEKIDRW